MSIGNALVTFQCPPSSYAQLTVGAVLTGFRVTQFSEKAEKQIVYQRADVDLKRLHDALTGLFQKRTATRYNGS